MFEHTFLKCSTHGFSFMSLSLSFKIQILSFHMIAYFFSFDLPIWTPKSDIIRGIYELFDACGRSCLSLPYLWHNFTFSFMSLALSFQIQILLFHMTAHFFSFDLPIRTLKSNIIRGMYELFDACGRSCLSLPYLSHNFTFFFMSLAWVSKFRFCHSVWLPTSLALIDLFEL